MQWDRSLKKSLRALTKEAEVARHQLTQVYDSVSDIIDDTKQAANQVVVKTHSAATETFESVTDIVDDTKHATDQFVKKTHDAVRGTFEDAVEISLQRVQKLAEERIEHIATDIQARVVKELHHRQVGIVLLCLSVTLGLCSGLLFSFALVYCAVTLLHLPIWAGFLSICLFFAVSSFGCFKLSKRHLVTTHS